MVEGTPEQKTQRLLNCELGSDIGQKIAQTLDEWGYRHVIVEFYTWVNTENPSPAYIREWLKENKPDLHKLILVKNRVLGN